MDDEAFYAAQEEAKNIEKRALEYKSYDGEVRAEAVVDLAPKELLDINYGDLINLYERTQKILSTQAMDIYSKEAKKEPVAVSAKTEEIESKLKEMTTETTEMAEKMEQELKKPITGGEAAAQEEKTTVSPTQEKIEFETITPEEKKKMEEEPKEEITTLPTEEVSKPPVLEEVPEKKQEPVSMPTERKIIIAVPSLLKQDPTEAAEKRFEEMRSRVKNVLGEKVNETELKKKMLELTKQLFKEKSTQRREGIKAEIAVIKNMLAGKTIKTTSKGKKVTEKMANSQLLESVINDQKTELSTTKDNLASSFKKQIKEASDKFYEDVKQENDKTKRKQLYETFVFSLTSLSEQLPEVIKQYQEFLSKKHTTELEKLLEILEEKETTVKNKSNERVEEIKGNYQSEFAAIKDIISRRIDNDMEAAGREVFEGEKGKGKGAKKQNVIFEINELDEGTMLYYLHSKDSHKYKEYELKKLSKAEAILEAKRLMAKEKGLSEDMIRKYFSSSEG